MPDDYNPIVLSGMVQRGGSCITTKLTAGFQFHLPYLTRSGQPTSILIATGPHVKVNLIVGLPFIQAMGMILDMTNSVAELKTLDTPPFLIEYHCTMVHVPIVVESKIRVSIADYQPVVKLIEDWNSILLMPSTLSPLPPTLLPSTSLLDLALSMQLLLHILIAISASMV